jgi:hypothetical protein
MTVESECRSIKDDIPYLCKCTVGEQKILVSLKGTVSRKGDRKGPMEQ